MKIKLFLTAVAILVSLNSFAQAHDGRRFNVVVNGDQLAAQGYLSGANPDDDGGGLTRPYLNAIHGHFGTAVLSTYSTNLPGFDVPTGTASLLSGADLEIELVGASKWVDPVNNSDPAFVPLDMDEVIGVGFNTQPSIDTDELGSFTLVSGIDGAALDLDLQYSIATDPVDTLYALEWILSTNQEGVADSESVYTILIPAGPALHSQALTAERTLGITAVPEPSSTWVLAIAGSIGLMRRRKR